MNRWTVFFIAGITLLTSAAGVFAAWGQDTTLEPIRRLESFRFGPDRSTLDAADAVVRDALAGKGDRRKVAEALTRVAVSAPTFDARQAACRRLVLLAGTEQVAPMASLLSEPALAHYALMVLARIPGPEVPRALRKALPTLNGAALLGAIGVLGERKDAEAVPLLADKAASPDIAVAEAAMHALALTGGPSAERAMLRVFMAAKPERKRAFAEAMLVRGEGLLASKNPARALTFYKALRNPEMPEPIQAAALRGVALAKGSGAVPLLLKELAGRAGPRRNMAASVLRTMAGSQVTRSLAQALRLGAPSLRVLLIDILSDRGDREAAAAVLKATEDAAKEVRLAAIRATGVLCRSEAVRRLLELAAGSDLDERAEAEGALSVLRGTGVDDALGAAIHTGSAAARAAAIRAIAARGKSIPLPQLLDIASKETGPARDASLQALRQYGGASELEPLMGLLMREKPGSRDVVADTVVEIARRTDRDAAARVVHSRLSATSKSEDRAEAAALLGAIGGDAALGFLITLAEDTDAEVRLAAVRALGEWPGPAPMPTLRKIAQNEPEGRLRTMAMRGYARMLGMPGNGVTQASAGDVLEEAVQMARSAEEKRLILVAIAAIGSERGLSLAMSLRDDPQLRAEAEMAALQACYLTAGAWPEATRRALEALASEASEESVRTGASSLLRTMTGFADFVMAWEVSPAYQQDGADFSRLFDVPFPPETAPASDASFWKPLPVGRSPEQPWLLDLLAVHGGEQKVAYIRTAVWCPADQELMAEIGTDDGLKVWWNGSLVHGNNIQRAVAPGQEKVRLVARTGWNLLMIKVTQNVMGWGACARLTKLDGSPAEGLRYMLPSALPGKL